MQPNLTSDLSQHFQTLNNTRTAKSRLNQLTQEMATGRVSDLASHLNGRTGQVLQLDREVALLTSIAEGSAQIAQRFTQQQNVLDGVDRIRSGLATQSLQAAQGGSNLQMDATAVAGRQEFDSLIARLNTQIGGRSMFGGAAVSQPPLASADDIMAGIVASLGGATDAAAVIAAVDTWFDDPSGGFATLGYTGGTGPARSFQIGRSDMVSDLARADDAGIRDVLRGAAMAAVAAELSGVLPSGDKAALLTTAGERLLAASDTLIDLRGRIGTQQQRLEEANVASNAERTAFQTARNDLVRADPFDTATRLQDAQQQLEIQYATTARLARLSLVNFI